MRYILLGVEPAIMIAESLSWKHLLQVVLIAATIALIVWNHEKMHPWSIVGIGCLMLGSALSALFEILHLESEVSWWLDIAPLILYLAALAIFLTLLYHDQDANQEASS
jgi:uncharacterized membrane protein